MVNSQAEGNIDQMQVSASEGEKITKKGRSQDRSPTGARVAPRLLNIAGLVVPILSSEWLVTRLNLPNGGGIVLVRSFLTTCYLYTVILGLQNALDPTRSWTFSLFELRVQVVETLHWFGALFAVAYTAFYARFAPQWM
jgi:hypothetical protein